MAHVNGQHYINGYIQKYKSRKMSCAPSGNFGSGPTGKADSNKKEAHTQGQDGGSAMQNGTQTLFI